MLGHGLTLIKTCLSMLVSFVHRLSIIYIIWVGLLSFKSRYYQSSCARFCHVTRRLLQLSLLCGLPAIQINKVQGVLSAAARLVSVTLHPFCAACTGYRSDRLITRFCFLRLIQSTGHRKLMLPTHEIKEDNNNI